MATYLLRTNLDIKGTKEDSKSLRFLTAVSTVRSLRGKNKKVVVLSHRGRPEGRDSKLSLKPLRKLFESSLKRKVLFLDNLDLGLARRQIEKARNGSVFLFENTRFLKGETENDPVLAKQLSELGDFFINDDFATAHRANASNEAITRFMPSKMGPNLKKEVDQLTKAIKNPRKPFVLIIGGAKMKDKMGIIRSLLPKADKVLLGGGVANTALRALGLNIRKSMYEPEMIQEAKDLVGNLKIVLPVDWEKGEDRILDIGPKTIYLYSEIIKSAKTIIWGGPMGYFEDERFREGSYSIARAIAKSRAFSIVGGGETAEIINILKLAKKIGLVSTGGGAMLDFLSGAKMPAIDALQKKKKK